MCAGSVRCETDDVLLLLSSAPGNPQGEQELHAPQGSVGGRSVHPQRCRGVGARHRRLISDRLLVGAPAPASRSVVPTLPCRSSPILLTVDYSYLEVRNMVAFGIVMALTFATWIGAMIYIITIGITDWFTYRRKS